jgi:beta-ureidopropionase / N-carbamoyl-L-amino-acid hydrolase
LPINDIIRFDPDLAGAIFDELAQATRAGRGIVRDSYGAGEQAAHDILRRRAAAIGLECAVDAIGNLTMTLPGRDRAAPRIIIGSHLDSVPQGGNFDGAAGVVAGFCALSALRDAGFVPSCDIVVMAIRAEESAWFDIAYIGSAGAFGSLDPDCLSVVRADTGLTLEATLAAQGFDPSAVRERRRLIEPSNIRVVTGIRGCKRFRNARCIGAYAHSGAVARPYRRDAVAATVELLHQMEVAWLREEVEGADLVLTSGEFYTDAAMHGPSKIAGETRFVLDIRSISDATMNALATEARGAAERIGEDYRVSFDLGTTSDSPPALMDTRLRAKILGLLDAPFEMASGAGHDAAVFAQMGIPSAMIFIRNENGSHNPDEAMTLDDFAVATRTLISLLVDFPF